MLRVSSHKQEEDTVLHDQHSKLDYLQGLKKSYRLAGRAAKTNLLDTAVEPTGYHRDYVATLLRSRHNLLYAKPQRVRTRTRIYGPEVRSLVLVVRQALFGACAELTQPVLVIMVNKLVACGELSAPSPEALGKLNRISVSTVKRIFKADHDRSYERLRLHGGTTTPGKLLKAQIRVRVSFWDTTTPGFCEVDTVSHNGGDPNGVFVSTVNMTDVLSGWTEPKAIMGKGERACVAAIDDIRDSQPVTLLGIDSDGGGEFINYHLQRYCQQQHIDFTRSRSGHKNDNAHVEQKNRVAVRQLVGHSRYDTPEQLRLLNELYRGPWRLYYNFFLPTRKVIKRSYDKTSGKVRFSYDQARTPYHRLLDHPDVPEAIKEQLQAMYATLNPEALLRQIHALRNQLNATVAIRGEEQEATDEAKELGRGF